MEPDRQQSFQPFHAKAGQVLFSPGGACPGLVLLRQGRIRVSMTGASGREAVLYRVAPGQICLQTFVCLTDDRAYSATAIAETDLDGELVPVADFQNLVASDDGFRARIFHAVAERFGQYQQLVEDLALTGFDARLARVLLRLADENGRLETTHEALAAETASGRAFVSRRLAVLTAEAVIARRRGVIEIQDQRRLSEIAADQGGMTRFVSK